MKKKEKEFQKENEEPLRREIGHFLRGGERKNNRYLRGNEEKREMKFGKKYLLSLLNSVRRGIDS